MVKFTEITNKTVRASYTKDDVPGYEVVGSAAQNKEGRLTDANGNIRENGINISNFNIYGSGPDTRINLTDCLAGRMSDAVRLAEATLADLSTSHPEE